MLYCSDVACKEFHVAFTLRAFPGFHQFWGRGSLKSGRNLNCLGLFRCMQKHRV